MTTDPSIFLKKKLYVCYNVARAYLFELHVLKPGLPEHRNTQEPTGIPFKKLTLIMTTKETNLQRLTANHYHF